jgi:cyclopropane-fatty-acyl-phospholipid synthase
MSPHPFRQRILQVLHDADIWPDATRTHAQATPGPAPWDLRIHDAHFYRRVLAQGSLGLGEAYMDGEWDVDDLDGLLLRLLRIGADDKVRGLGAAWDAVRARVSNLQSEARAFQVGQRHYDLGNDLYRAMLGKRMVYSCGYWRTARDLDEAQEAKLDLVCRKLGLHAGMRVLDIGCGWGEALKFAAERYGVRGVGCTVSREQAEYARELCAGLPIEIRLMDYRDLDCGDGGFDRIFSLGMFEHVGVRNYDTYFDVARRCIAPDARDGGLFLLHTIGGNRSVNHTDPWIARYIFPNSMLPSAKQIASAVEGRFVIEDWHNFGADYDRTLQAWRENIERHWDTLPPRYDERFRRMWRYYLSASMAAFRARRIQLWQLVLSPEGVPGGYIAAR